MAKIEDEISGLIDKLSSANDILFRYISDRIAQLDDEKKKIENQILDNQKHRIKVSNPELLNRALTKWDDFSFEEKKYIAQMFIDKVVIYNGQVDIIYK